MVLATRHSIYLLGSFS